MSLSVIESVIGTLIPFFRPMHGETLKRFPTAPTGWLPIYIALPRVPNSEAEFRKDVWESEHWEELLMKGADWFVENLSPEACGSSMVVGFVQWDQKEVLPGGSIGCDYNARDWRDYTNSIFPHGPKGLSDELHRRGLKLGTWMIPQGWDAEDLYKEHRDWFLHYPDGTPISFGWMGKYVRDGSNPEALKVLTGVMRKIAYDWGVDFYEIDGNWSSQFAQFASAEPYFYDRSVPWWESPRRLLQAMRDGVGPDKSISMDAPIPLFGMGIVNGSRTAHDQNFGTNPRFGARNCCMDWQHGALTARTGTMDYYFLNRTGWYCDRTDAFLVGWPLTTD